MSEALRQRISDAIAHTPPADRADRFEQLPLSVTLSQDFTGYHNVRVTSQVNSLSSREVTHLKYIPMEDEGLVVALPATPGEKGAVEFIRSGSRRTGTVNLRDALSSFHLRFPPSRKLRLPFTTVDLPSNEGVRRVALLLVKNPASPKRNLRKRPAPPQTPPQAPPQQA